MFSAAACLFCLTLRFWNSCMLTHTAVVRSCPLLCGILFCEWYTSGLFIHSVTDKHLACFPWFCCCEQHKDPYSYTCPLDGAPSSLESPSARVSNTSAHLCPMSSFSGIRDGCGETTITRRAHSWIKTSPLFWNIGYRKVDLYSIPISSITEIST